MGICQNVFLTVMLTENIHNIFTRNRKQIHIKKTKNQYIESKTITITGATPYNSLPSIKDSKSVKTFKKNFKETLLKRYYLKADLTLFMRKIAEFQYYL